MKHKQAIANILIYLVFLGFFIWISYSIITHYTTTQALINQAEIKIKTPVSGPGSLSGYQASKIGESDIIEFRNHLSSIFPCFCATIILYAPVAMILFMIGFATALGASYNPYSKMVPFARGLIQFIDSIPLVLWVFLAVIIVFRVSHSDWGPQLSIFYYPVLSLSYGMVLIVIFFQQNRRIIDEIQSSNILKSEIVSGVNTGSIIWRMFRFHFARTIMVRQLIYAFLYILLFDYCLMYIFENFRQTAWALTPLTVKAGLFFKRLEYFKSIDKNELIQIYSHLHASALFLILLLALICFFILFYFFDRKDIIND
jgi:hypothetical protein